MSTSGRLWAEIIMLIVVAELVALFLIMNIITILSLTFQRSTIL